jgi:nucleoid-associated protein YgaU
MNNNPNYHRTGLDAVVGQRQGNQQDPLIGETPEPPRNWPASYGQQTVQPDIAPENEFGQFVTLKGGEYFFSASLTFLKSLSNQPSPGEFYVVKSGDFLFNIAERAYGDGNLLEVIYEANKDVIGDDPDVIVPGQRLFIPLL